MGSIFGLIYGIGWSLIYLKSVYGVGPDGWLSLSCNTEGCYSI